MQDAKDAGLHPLFAMGTAGSYSPSGYSGSSVGSVPPAGFSGSYAGEGLAEAGRAIASGVRGAASAKREQELHVLRLQKMRREIMLDDAALMKAASDRKMAEQAAMYWGDSQAGITGPDLTAKTYPYGRKSGPRLNVRPLQATGRTSLPQYTELVGPKGRRMVLNQDSGLDEVAQVEYVARPWYDYVSSGFSNKFRPKMSSPKSYYYYWKNFYKRKYRAQRKKAKR